MTILSPDDLQELKALRDVFDYGPALKRLDDFGKWIFTAVATVATVGAGLSNSAFKVLTSVGRISFGIAIILSGLSLVAATLLIAPHWEAVNRWSRDSMRYALESGFRRRRVYTAAAGLFLALALTFAGIAPALSGMFPDKPVTTKLGYSYSKGNLEIAIALAGAAPNTDAVLTVTAVSGEQTTNVARVFMHMDDSGSATRTLQITVGPGAYTISYRCKAANGTESDSPPERITLVSTEDKPPSSTPGSKS